MNEADWIILMVLGFSGLVSLMRGFVKEALSLLSWVLAFVVAVSLGPKLSYLLAGWFAHETLRLIAAFVLLFFATLIVGGLVNTLVVSMIARAGLIPIDRLLGTAFGVLRGSIVVLAVLIIVPPFIAVDEQAWWRESVLIPKFMSMEGWAKETLGDIASWRAAVISG